MQITLAELKNRISILKRYLSSCRLCPRECGVNRLRGEKGFCRAGNALEVSYVGLHHGEEPPISGTKGSGAIFFKYCTLRCVFCQNWQISQPLSEKVLETKTEHLVSKILELQHNGAHNLNLVSPTQYLPQILELIAQATKHGFNLPIVYNTNGYERLEIIKLLNGIVDIYLPDLKYADNELAFRFSGAKNYLETAEVALREMYAQTELIVRHLVLPGFLDNTKKCLDIIAGISPDIQVSLMAQYSPQHKAAEYPPLNRKLSEAEYAEAVDYAQSLGLENCWVQELGSQDVFIPDFNGENPFK